MKYRPLDPPPIPEDVPEEHHEDYLRDHGLAHSLKHRSAAAYVRAAAVDLSDGFSTEAFVIYLEQLLEEAGNPKDPLERMLIEQVAMAHHNVGRLYVRLAVTAGNLEAEKAYSAAAARLLAEMRRTVLAVKKYREEAAPPNVHIVRQQNVAHHQQIAYVEGEDQDSSVGVTREKAVQPKGKKKHVARTKQSPPPAIESKETIDILHRQHRNGQREKLPIHAQRAR